MRCEGGSERLGLGARFTFTLPTVGNVEIGGTAELQPGATRSTRRRQRNSGEPVRVMALDYGTNDLRYIRDNLAGRPVQPTPTEYAMLAERSAHAGRSIRSRAANVTTDNGANAERVGITAPQRPGFFDPASGPCQRHDGSITSPPTPPAQGPGKRMSHGTTRAAA